VKVPTELAYIGNEIRFGYDIPSDVEPLRWFKLLLVKEEELPEHVRNSTDIKKIHEAHEALRRAGKTPIEVIGDYLKFLWDQVTAAIERSQTLEAVNGIPYTVVLTVPAIWNEEAIAKMKIAAKRAGILDRRRAGETDLQFIQEPEAAALATYADVGEYQVFQPGQLFIVCDCGGVSTSNILFKAHIAD
jgi:molecular chaperone DnaK (HSP70)